MTRRIVTVRRQAVGGADVDRYLDRVVKYVPADIVAAWLTVIALLPASPSRPPAVLWVVLATMVALTPVWIVRVTRRPADGPAWTQALVSTAAFVVWVFATGRPFSDLSFYDPAYGGLALILFTLLSGVIVPAGDVTPT
jgi:hypothetical protein